MALPNGYRPVTWGQVQQSSIISEVYILEDGRATPYGPYRVLDASTRKCQDNSGFGGPVEFIVGVSEIIGVPDPAYVQKPATPLSVAAAVGPAVSSIAVASQLYDELFDAVTTQIASKASHIDQATRMKLEAEARIKREVFVKHLANALTP